MQSFKDIFSSILNPVKDSNNSTIKLVVGGAGSLVIATLVCRYLRNKCNNEKKKYPKDLVVVHSFEAGKLAPSISPFVVKLETFLRMANVTYVNEPGMNWSKKGKIPWISYNDQEMADSQFSIEFLKKERKLNCNGNYSASDLAIGRAFQKMIEENTSWCLILDRWVYQNSPLVFEWMGFTNCLLLKVFSMQMNKAAYCQGIGRHTADEIDSIFVTDMDAVSQFLGNKKFMLGDEASECDCAIYGFLTQIYYHSPGSKFESYMKDNLTNLCDYCERMKEKFWPDWELACKGEVNRLT